LAVQVVRSDGLTRGGVCCHWDNGRTASFVGTSLCAGAGPDPV